MKQASVVTSKLKTWQGQVNTAVITDAARELDGAAGVIEDEDEETEAAGPRQDPNSDDDAS